MVDNAYLLRRRGAFGVAVNFSGGDSRTSWYILPGNVTSKGPPGPSGVAPSESHLNRMTNGLDTGATEWTNAEGSRRDAALTIVGVDPAVAGYLAPSLLVPVTTTTPGCVVRLRGAIQVRGSARFSTDTFTHLASKAGTRLRRCHDLGCRR
ncbi:hypothetical protein ALC56_02267 [Trachymyrmex septentrionalis]|uniref:Uncharacterized protein n=1 Tax=Trachymyrmex septentrionalis TaxID=34720 RepID=A0A195FTV3_9HYME|nr:hypothetical protein ALC56_02267 [Trachymyrmex septentrionalis]